MLTDTAVSEVLVTSRYSPSTSSSQDRLARLAIRDLVVLAVGYPGSQAMVFPARSASGW